jgi:hypothetical protein
VGQRTFETKSFDLILAEKLFTLPAANEMLPLSALFAGKSREVGKAPLTAWDQSSVSANRAKHSLTRSVLCWITSAKCVCGSYFPNGRLKPRNNSTCKSYLILGVWATSKMIVHL